MGGPGSNDGVGTAARFMTPSGIWSDGQSLFVADDTACTIRQIAIATNQVTTLAGAPQQCASVDGVGANARFVKPDAIWGDGANLYVGDNGRVIRKIVIAAGEVSTFVGSSDESAIVDGPKDQARLGGDAGLWGDGSYLYVANAGKAPQLAGVPLPVEPGAIRAISIATGETHSIAMPPFFEQDLSGHNFFQLVPDGLWAVDGYLYTTWYSPSDSLNIGRINLVTQEFERLFNFALNPPYDVYLPGPRFYPQGFWFDGGGNFYYCEGAALRRISVATGEISTVTMLPQNSGRTFSRAIWGVGGSLFVTDREGSFVSRVDLTPQPAATIVAGLPLNRIQPDAIDYAFYPFGGRVLWVDGTSVYASNDASIRKYDLAANLSGTLASGVRLISELWIDPAGIYGVLDTKQLVRFSASGDRTLIASGFTFPAGIWGNDTYLFIADNSAIRRVDKTTGENIVFAGTDGSLGAADGIGTQAQFRTPIGLWGDGGYLYVADSGNSAIRRIRMDTAEVTTFAGNLQQRGSDDGRGANARFFSPTGLWGDGATLYVTDTFGTTRKIAEATGDVSTLANFAGGGIWGAGPYLYVTNSSYFGYSHILARMAIATGETTQLQPSVFYSAGLMPRDRFSTSVEWSDGWFLYGVSGHAIYRTRIASGEIEHVAGAFVESGRLDGVGNDARFLQPIGLWGDGTYLYAADGLAVRRIVISTRQVTTLATGFQNPAGIWGDGTYLYVTDMVNRSLERVTIATGQITRLSGGDRYGYTAVDGIGLAGRFGNIGRLWGDGSNLYIRDGCSIRTFNLATAALTTFVGDASGPIGDCSHIDGPRDIARFKDIHAIWGDGMRLFVSDPYSIRTVDLKTGEVQTIAGDANLLGSINGPAPDARFLGPGTIWGDGQTLFVADNGIRMISFPSAAPAFRVTQNGAIHLKTPSSSGQLTIAYARQHPGAGSANPNGVAIFSNRVNGVLVSETAVPASPAIQSGRIYAETAGTIRTGIALANPNDAIATVSFYFTNAAGAVVGSGVTTIPGNQQIARFLDEDPFNALLAARSFTFASSVPIGAIALRGEVNERSEFLMTTLPIVPLTPNTSAPLVLPHFAAGGGWTTQVVLVNPTDTPLTGALDMDQQYPYSLAPRSALSISSTAAGAQPLTGNVRITPTGGTSAPGVSTIFSLVTNGITVTQNGVATTGIGQSFRVFAEYDAALLLQTALAVANTSVLQAAVRFELLGLDGQPTGFTSTVNIPSNGHLALFLTELPGFQTMPASLQGILRISSTTPISAIGLRSHRNERSEFLISTMPAIADDAAPPTGDLLFPHVVTGGGFTTEFVLMSSGTASSGVIPLHSQAGADLALQLVR